MKRRDFIFTSSVGLATLVFNGPRGTLYATASTVTVFKDRTCSCCNGWIEHLKANAFQVSTQEVENSELRAIKDKYGIPSTLQACHTGTVDEYVIEGHVPAAEIRRLLMERPKAIGLVVPGMPVGSPGMEGTRNEKYSVSLFDESGRTSVYQEYNPER